jgi:hypothetical protein
VAASTIVPVVTPADQIGLSGAKFIATPLMQ